MGATFAYAAGLIPEISDDIVNIDRAMRWGFNWRHGPFELMDRIGPRRLAEMLGSSGTGLPKMLDVLLQSSASASTGRTVGSSSARTEDGSPSPDGARPA